MPIFSEDVIIRILTDSTQGVREVKKVNTELKTMGAQAKLSSKELLGIGAAFGGISAVIDLGVKAVNSYVQKIKEASDEYITLTKESGDYYDDAIDAIDRLEEAEARLAEARARAANEDLESFRNRRAARKEESAFLIENAELIDFFTNQLIQQGADIDSAWILAIDKAKEYIDLVSTYETNDNFQRDAEGAADALDRANKLLEDQEEALKRWLAADERVDAALLRLRFDTEKLGKAGIELLEVQRRQAIELIQLNEYYGEHQEELIEATNQYYNQAIAIERNAEAMAKLDEVVQNLTNNSGEISGAFEDIGDLMQEAWGPERIAEMISGLNALGGAVNGFLNTTFGDTKNAAIAQSAINTALAITNALANVPFPYNLAAAALMLAQGVAQQVKIKETYKAALGTPAGGYIVPPGYEGDSFPVMARSGERVTVDRPGEGGMMTNISLILDGSVLARTTTDLVRNRQVTIRATDIVA